MDNDWRSWGAGEWLALFAKVVIGLIVIAFLAIHTLNFARFVFPPEQVYYSYLFIGLTGGAVLAYLVILKWGSKNSLSKVIAIVMLAVSAIGELLAAGFGMQVEGYQKSGIVVTAEDLTFMIRAVQVLGAFHALALIMSFAGAEIMDAFSSITAVKSVSPAPIPAPLPAPAPSNNLPTGKYLRGEELSTEELEDYEALHENGHKPSYPTR